ncbi:MAG: CHAD domain-containing protein [Bacteroidales bacterium]|nr:CHAD domain-containing protein [Bacteroidales bacterium]
MENNNLNNLAIYQFLETQLQLFKGHFLITQASMDEEAIHQMRVAIKRIRTIQKLKKHIHFPTIIDDDQYSSIKTIFTVSGNLRDLQIQQILLKGYMKVLKSPFTHLSGYLSSQEKVLTEKLNTTISQTDFSSFPEIPEPEESLSGLEDTSDLRLQSIDFLKKKLEKIFKLIYILDQDEHVHDLRKQVKQLFFILQFLYNHFPESAISDFNLGNIKNVGERIGDWNDRDMFLVMLNNFIARQPGNFLFANAEYKILNYLIDYEKQNFLSGIAVDMYLELAKLNVIFENDPDNFLYSESTVETNPGSQD